MFKNVSQSYTLADASSEIGIMLLGAFILWMMFAWLLKPRYKKEDNSSIKAATKPTYAKKKVVIAKDDLQLIEGVGPAIEKLFHKHGIMSFKDIVKADVEWLEDILELGWNRFKAHSPTTWPDQARLASKWKWSELEEYQEILNGGK